MDRAQQPEQDHIQQGGSEREQAGTQQPPRTSQLHRFVERCLQCARRRGSGSFQRLAGQRVHVRWQDREDRCIVEPDRDGIPERLRADARRSCSVDQAIDELDRRGGALGRRTQQHRAAELDNLAVAIDERRRFDGGLSGGSGGGDGGRGRRGGLRRGGRLRLSRLCCENDSERSASERDHPHSRGS